VIGEFSSFTGCDQNCLEYSNLYLTDFVTGQIDPVLPSIQFWASGFYSSVAWSPDGSKVFAYCERLGLCVIPVQKTG
jgi:hypothetical protein